MNQTSPSTPGTIPSPTAVLSRRKKLKKETIPIGTKRLSLRQISEAKRNWNIFGWYVIKLSVLLTQLIEKSDPKFKTKFRYPAQRFRRNGMPFRLTRYDTAIMCDQLTAMIKAGRFPGISKNQATHAVTWFRLLRNSYYHFNLARILRNPQFYLTSILVLSGPHMLDNRVIFDAAKKRLDEAGWIQHPTLPAKEPKL